MMPGLCDRRGIRCGGRAAGHGGQQQDSGAIVEILTAPMDNGRMTADGAVPAAVWLRRRYRTGEERRYDGSQPGQHHFTP